MLVEGPGANERFVSPAEIKTEVEGDCTLRSTPGGTPTTTACNGMRVRTLLEGAGVDLGAIHFFTVPRADGTTGYLPAAYLEEGAFPEGPARVWVEGNSGVTRFIRPPTSDPNDVNALDNIATRPDEALVIGVSDGNLLQVRAEATPTSIQAGSPVQLTASASGAREGEEVRFRWTFGDGGSAEGASVSHSFGGSGTYEVRVTAVGSEESGGESEPVAVVVGNPPTTNQPGAAPAKKQTHRKPSGANGKGREGRGGKGSEGQGGSGKEGKGSGSGDATEAGEPSSAGAESETDEAPPLSPESSATAPPEPAESESALAPPAASGPSTAPPAPEPTAPQPSGGETVEGRLVANLLDPTEAAAALSGSSSEGSRSAPGAGDDGGSATIPVAAFIVLGLLGAGAALELRSRPRRRPR